MITISSMTLNVHSIYIHTHELMVAITSHEKMLKYKHIELWTLKPILLLKAPPLGRRSKGPKELGPHNHSLARVLGDRLNSI